MGVEKHLLLSFLFDFGFRNEFATATNTTGISFIARITVIMISPRWRMNTKLQWWIKKRPSTDKVLNSARLQLAFQNFELFFWFFSKLSSRKWTTADWRKLKKRVELYKDMDPALFWLEEVQRLHLLLENTGQFLNSVESLFCSPSFWLYAAKKRKVRAK